MKIASTWTRLSRTLVDNVGLGVKFSRTLGNGNALLVTAKRESLKGIIGEKNQRW